MKRSGLKQAVARQRSGAAVEAAADVGSWRLQAAAWDAAGLRDAAQAVGVSLTDGELGALGAYAAALQRWGGVYNLTAVLDADGIRDQHLVDCLATVPPLRRWLMERGLQAARVADIGSGGGLPGVVWALVCPGLSVSCIDSVAKKVAFVRQVGLDQGLLNRLQAVHGRVQALRPSEPEAFDVVASRAFASLVDFTAWTKHLLRPGGIWLALKGRHPEAELVQLAASAPDVDVFHVEPLHLPGDPRERCLVWMRPRR